MNLKGPRLQQIRRSDPSLDRRSRKYGKRELATRQLRPEKRGCREWRPNTVARRVGPLSRPLTRKKAFTEPSISRAELTVRRDHATAKFVTSSSRFFPTGRVSKLATRCATCSYR